MKLSIEKFKKYVDDEFSLAQLEALADVIEDRLVILKTAIDKANHKTIKGFSINEAEDFIYESLRDWFKKEKWVRISSSGNIAGPCGTSKNKKNPDRCLPRAKAQSLTKAQRAATAAKKKKAGAKGKTVVKNTKKATVKKETKGAPKGHYFTASGNLVKGRLTKDARERGARLSDPKDKQRSKVPPVTQYNEEMAPTGIGITGDQLDDLNKLGAIAGVEVIVRDKDGSNVRKVDYTLTNTSYEKNPDDIDIPQESIKEAVKKVIKHVLNENHQSLDIEVARRIEGLLNINKKSDFLKAGYRLIEDLVEDDPFDRNDVISHLANELNLYTPIRDLFKEGALNEGRGDLDMIVRIIDDRADESGFEPREEAAEVIAAIADHYKLNLKMIQNYLDSDGPVNPVAEENINEALNKSLQDFGPDLQKRLQTVGFNTKLSSETPNDEIRQKLRENPKLAYIHFNRGSNYEEIVVFAGRKAQQKIQKIIDYFNLDSTSYGPDKDAGWVIKNAINKNPGDIMVSKIELLDQLTNVRFYRFEKGAYKNVKTTDKATGKADFLQAAE